MPEQDTRENLRKLIVYVRPYVGGLVLALMLTVFLTAIQMTPPLVVMFIIDNVIVEGNWGLLWVLLLVSILIPLLAAGLRVWNTYLMSYISFKLIMDIRLDIYRRILALPMAFHEEIGTGKVMSRIMGDVVTVRSMVTRRVLEMVTDLVTFLTAVTLCLGLNWKLGLLMFVLMPLYFLNSKIFIGGMRSAWRTWRKKMDQVSVGLQERLGGVQLVKSYGRERHENRVFVEETRESLDYAMRGVVFRAHQETGNWAVTGVRNTLVFCLGCYFVIQGEMTYGAVMAFQAYAMQMFHPVLNLIHMATEFERMKVSVDRIYEILNWPIEIADKPDAVELPRPRGHVRFDQVSFEYVSGEPVLKDIRLEVPAGTMVALVGHTGCGKTTLTSLLMRFYDVKEGAITVDGHDLRDVQLRSLRRQIGQVLQDSVLFNMSIRDNLKYGRLDATDEEIMGAARIGEIHEFIMRTAQGYDTKLGEDGIKLSVGEKQRLSIARAVLTDPAILILDEATSSLDSLSEALIQKAMANVMEGRTAFVIAHRLSTIISANMIVVMDHGEIKEVGTHAELLEKPDGMYRKLYEQQYAGLEEAEAEAAG
ncbi:MAG: ABC transporter ATP-binding protein [Candidatus Latescibacteria bacterium]|nr:ABC transporter ATP-binding protein [Candidatus Latescibacterota bacterium]